MCIRDRIEDHGNALGLYDDDLEKEDEMEKDEGAEEMAVPGFSLFQRRHKDNSEKTQNSEGNDQPSHNDSSDQTQSD